MNSRTFINVICWLVQNNRQPMDHENFYQRMTSQLWPNTKVRTQRWKAAIGGIERHLRTDLTKTSDANNPAWCQFFAVAQEVLLAESLSRTFFAVVASRTQCKDVADIANDVITDNLEMRRRVLQIVDSAPIVLKRRVQKTIELVTLNEHITDLMLSQLPDRDASRPFAIKPQAFDDFVNCAGTYQDDVIHQANAALGMAFATGIDELTSPTSSNDDVNAKIVNNMLELFEDASSASFSAHASMPIAV